ncbi:MAG: fumarylacetoacetase [Anaerolineales bacterium]|nr:fumarylacetoacetase [Anaerolineales bacterium]
MHSFIPVSPTSQFPLQNLPYGVFKPRDGSARVGVAIGEYVVDLNALDEAGLFAGTAVNERPVFGQPSLNAFLALGPAAWREVRATLQKLLSADEPRLRDDFNLRAQALHLQTNVQLQMPVEIGDYTDFYSSYHHAHNVGTMLRGADNALMPNWKHLPVAYHGRASSVVLSGTPVRRPLGQSKPATAEAPIFGPSRNLDFELELGFLIGPGNELGQPIPIEHAERHIFGMVLVNDWSARDIQAWEYQPLGPFLAKNFATSISPWVVPLEALAPFKQPLPAQEPEPLPYLRRADDWTYDIALEVSLQSARMEQSHPITRTNFNHLYWSISQQLAHHTVNGCNLRTGDLLASGTISGPTPEARGSLLELTWRGSQPLSLPNGEQRKFIEDGDRITISGYCQADGYRVGFGECTGVVVES